MNWLSNKGETLIEVVMSVALFSITMIMLASMFFFALKSFRHNYDTEQEVDLLVNAAVRKESTTAEQSFTITFQLDGTESVTQPAARLQTKLPGTGSLYQFEIR